MTASKKSSTARAAKGSIPFRPGFVIAPEVSATGGVSYRRTDEEQHAVGNVGLERDYRTLQKIDNVDLVRESKSIIARCYYLFDKHCTKTPLGYFCDEKQLAGLEAEIDEMREAAQLFNNLAKELRSARRVNVEIFPLALQLDNEHAVKRIVRSVRERLVELRDTLKSGQRKPIEDALDKARNLDRLATGIQADAVRFALDAAREEKSLLLDRIRDAGTKPDDFDGLAKLGEACNVETIEAAIDHFTMPESAASAAA